MASTSKEVLLITESASNGMSDPNAADDGWVDTLETHRGPDWGYSINLQKCDGLFMIT